jgi:hypothetical protein
MLSIVYISSAVEPFSDADLQVLLSQSQEKNARLDITGILLYKDGNIMQLFEGPDEAVKNLAKTIYADQRHYGIIQLIERRISTRAFPEWSMQFQDLSGPKIQQLASFIYDPAPSPTLQKHYQENPMLRLLATFGYEPADNA